VVARASASAGAETISPTPRTYPADFVTASVGAAVLSASARAWTSARATVSVGAAVESASVRTHWFALSGSASGRDADRRFEACCHDVSPIGSGMPPEPSLRNARYQPEPLSE
jgi:hypothetical protein